MKEKKLNNIDTKKLISRTPKSLEELKKEFPNDDSLRKILYTLTSEKWVRVIGNMRYHRDYGEQTRDQIEQNAFELYVGGVDINNLAPDLKERNPDQFGNIKYKYQDINQNKRIASRFLRQKIAMETKKSPDSSIIKTIKRWKKDQGIESLTFDELKKEVKDKKLIIEQKVDGQSAILDYEKGKDPKFGSLGGLIYTDLPVLKEAKEIFKNNDIKQAQIVGELAAMKNNKITEFHETQHIIKNPDTDKTKLHWFPYQIISLNDKKYKDDFNSYKESWPEIRKLFKNSKYIHPVGYMEDDLEKAWEKFVKKEKNEGIVIRTSDNQVYKSKPVFTYDLVILAVGDKKKKNWENKMIGNTLMAFMDKDEVFRTAGEVGTGWSDKQAEELFDWAQNNKVDEDEHYIWVKPKKIMEIKWERSNIKEMPAYKYFDGEYKSVDKKLSGTIVKPVFIRYRDDKSVNPSDLRLTQIPDWEKTKKMAHKIVSDIRYKQKRHQEKKKKIARRIVTNWVGHFRAEPKKTDLDKKKLSYLVVPKLKENIKEADYPDHPDDIVISKKENIENLAPIKEINIYNYYEGIKNDLIKELKGNDLFIVVKPDSKPVYIRHPYDKKSEFIRINNEKDFEEYHSGRTVEYHLTMPKMTPKYIIDYDPNENEKWDKTKENIKKIVNEMNKLPKIKKTEIRYTGKRGFHVHGILKEEQEIDSARNFLENWLKKIFKERDDLTVSESPTKNKSALGLSPMKYNGGHVAKHSLRVSGLCCVEVPRNKLKSFEKKDASMPKTYKKVTGKEFKSKEAAKRIIEAFLRGPIHERELGKTQRLKKRFGPNVPSRPSKEKYFAEPGETIEVLENGKWVKRKYSPSLKEKEIRPVAYNVI